MVGGVTAYGPNQGNYLWEGKLGLLGLESLFCACLTH